jgi:hypothetical protein
MSTRYNNGSHYENHQRAAELHDQAAHSHRSAADHNGKQDHQTGQEQSARAREHSQQAYLKSQEVHREATTRSTFGHEETAALAHKLWRDRGCPQGSPELDWSLAVEELRSRKL